MALTRSFKQTVRARADRDPKFRNGLLKEAIEALLRDDLDEGQTLLRDYVSAEVDFEGIALAIRPRS